MKNIIDFINEQFSPNKMKNGEEIQVKCYKKDHDKGFTQGRTYTCKRINDDIPYKFEIINDNGDTIKINSLLYLKGTFK